MPRIRRPPLTSSRVAAILASRPALRNPVHMTSVPSSTRLVASAIAGKDRPALEDPARLAVRAEEQVVEHPDRVEPGALGRQRDVTDERVAGRSFGRSSEAMGRTIRHASDPSSY